MYNGDEKLINDGTYLPYTMLDFWRSAYSNILHNMQRGTLAEFIVKCSLERGGIITNSEIGTGFEPYDLEGPIIKSTGKPSRIEVKSAAYVQLWDIKHPERISFSIAPAKLPDETGDYSRNSYRTRNNDLYVFSLYTATDRRRNILDLSWWQFYVMPTYMLNEDHKLKSQKTISLTKIKSLCSTLSFDMLCGAIMEACNTISAKYDSYVMQQKSMDVSTPPPRKTCVIFQGMNRKEPPNHLFDKAAL